MKESEDTEPRPVDSSTDDATIPHVYEVESDKTQHLSNEARADAAKKNRRLGRYRLLPEPCHGGQGAVYLAEDERVRRKVALKVSIGGGSSLEDI